MRPTNEKTCTSPQVTSLILSILLAFLTCTASLSAQTPGTFIPTGNMTMPRFRHTATLLLNGKVLITGGGEGVYVDDSDTSAELYDPLTRTFTATGNMTTGRFEYTATLLPDGRVLIAGGYYLVPLATAELYDPATGTFTATGNMVTAHFSHKATLLNNGKVLIAGGASGYSSLYCNCPILAKPELYDPATGTFTVTGDYADKNVDPDFGTFALVNAPATLLSNGKVLIAAAPTAELFDAATGTFSLTGQMATEARYIAGRTANLLTDGKVLLAGGENQDYRYFANADAYDLSTGKFTALGKMTRPREKHTATLLRDGTVLIAGNDVADASTELYDPATGTFAATAGMISPRSFHSATLLMDGTILITGGVTCVYCIGPGLGETASAELYIPSLLVPAQVVTDLRLDRTSVGAGSSYAVNISGSNLTSQTFFDIRFTAPGSNASDVVLNWQSGLAASHDVPAGTAAGSWTINGVRAHEIESDHTGNFIPVTVTITVSP